MDEKSPEIESNPTIKELYPHMDEEELKEAEENFKRYLEVVLQIYERIQADPKTFSNFSDFDILKKKYYD